MKRKSPKKGKPDYFGKATETGAAIGGGLAGAVIGKQLADKANPMLAGLVPLLGGVALDVMTEDPNLRAAGKGLAAVGGVRMLAQSSKDGKMAENMGVQFFKKKPKGGDGTSGFAATEADAEYQRMLQEAAAASMSGAAGYDDYDDDLDDDLED